MPAFRLAILGAGPIGLEAALRARHAGIDTQLFEQGDLADSVSRWSFVRLFSPFKLNRSDLGAQLLTAAGIQLPDPEAFLTGAELIDQYLAPLSRLPLLAGVIHLRHAVTAIGRSHFGKGAPLGAARGTRPFRLLLNGPNGEQEAFFDGVLDCTGCYRQPLLAGDGGIPAIGEEKLNGSILYGLHDVNEILHRHPDKRRFAVIGSGMSAVTTLDALLSVERTEVDWVTRSAADHPYCRHEQDPLPERDRLAELGNKISDGAFDNVRRHRGQTLRRVQLADRDSTGALILTLSEHATQITADHLLVQTGFAPDRSLYAELQFHECYASAGPMKLAATLLDDTSGDCLAQTGSGVETLRTPEPNFFVLGAKSYGRKSHFLIRLGLEQIEEWIPELVRAATSSAAIHSCDGIATDAKETNR